MAGTDRPSRRVSLRIVKLPSCARAIHAGFKALVPLRFFVSIYAALGDSLAEYALPLSQKSSILYCIYVQYLGGAMENWVRVQKTIGIGGFWLGNVGKLGMQRSR
jgi:hypothetical protein